MVRAGTPPGIPGFHCVRRCAGISVNVPTETVEVPVFEVSATLVATTWYVPVLAGAV